MKDPARQPTPLRRLRELIDGKTGSEGSYHENREKHEEDTTAWLTWTYNFLSARKEYHRKARIKSTMLEKMAKTLLSKDELDMIDRQAEEQLAGSVTEEEPETEEEEMPE